MEYTYKTTQTSQENCTPCNRRNISYHMMKYTHVTRKTSCDRKYTSCDKRSICHRRIFSCEINNISCDRKFISCDRNKKEHLVSQYIFPVNERIFTVTGNEYPVIGLGETHQSLINLLVSTRLWGLSFNGLKKHPNLIFCVQCPNGQGPSVHWSLDCVFLPSLVLGYNFMLIIVLMMTRFFPLFRAKLFTGKLGSQEISNFIPPCF